MNINRNRITINDPYNVSYEIIFTSTLFHPSNDELKQHIQAKKCVVFISPTVGSLYLKTINDYFLAHVGEDKFKIVTVPTGEVNKNIENALNIIKEVKQFGLSRKDIMVAVGGGILLDIVGFAASMLNRRFDYIRIPTTLVGQIDAGIGIKTGVNYLNSKNCIGSYHTPVVVLNDLDFLKTLRIEDIKTGLSEIIKIAVVNNNALFECLEGNFKQLLLSNFQNSLGYQVCMSASTDMLSELQENYFEHNLERIVDFGHTFSPFIEQYSGFSIKHGMAVAIDMAISTEVSYLLQKISCQDRNRIIKLLTDVGLEVYNSKVCDVSLMMDSLYEITLRRGGYLNLVLPLGIGSATFLKRLDDLSIDILSKALQNLKSVQALEVCGQVV